MVLLCGATVALGVPLPLVGERLDVGGYVDGRAVVGTEHAPAQAPQGLAALSVSGRIVRGLSARLELRGRWGGAPRGGSGAGFVDWDDAFEHNSPAVEVADAWIEARRGSIELRAGVQRFAWGKLDGVPPTDVLNPRDYHDPLVTEAEDAKIGVPAVAVTWRVPQRAAFALQGVRTTLVWVPFAVPARLPLPDERWFSPEVSLGRRIDDLPPLRLTPSASQALSVRNRVQTANDAPSRRIADGGLGLRIAGSLAGADWDLYGYTGPDTGPNAGLSVVAWCARRDGLCRNLGRSDRPLVLRTDSRIEQRQSTMRMLGGDVAMPVGPVTVRAEVAYLQDRHLLRSVRDVVTAFTATLGRRPALVNAVLAGRARRLPLAPLFPAEDVVDFGVGVDTVWRGWLPLLQVNQTILLDPAPARLVVADPETRLSGVVRRRFFAEQAEFELRGAWVFERDAWFIYPRIAFRPWDAVRLRIGYVAVGGDPVSMLGQYHANDELTLELRYSF